MTKLSVLMMVGLIALMPLLSGCGIGYTRTLFATKTNVGFDASTTPPTLELDINRLEGVVAPQFENGKKLPVLASFRFANNGFFSPNIGSAFATGDAANTLAALYSEETPYTDWISRANAVKGDDATDDSGNPGDPFPGDSTLVLDAKPQVMPWMPDILEFLKPEFQKKEVRPVFFGTDTSLGIKVAWSGMTGQFPDSAKLGYNRKELALVPISMQQKDSKYRMKMSSLLATVDSGVNGTDIGESGPELDFEHLQYFATGNAATLLALQKDVRKAMLVRLDPNQESYKEKFSPEASEETRRVAFRLLNPMYRLLRSSEDSEAKRLGDSMDALAPSDLTMNLTYYEYADGHLVETKPNEDGYPYSALSGSNFQNFHSYYSKVEAAISVLTAVVPKGRPPLVELSTVNGNAVPNLPEKSAELREVRDNLERRKSDFDKRLDRNATTLDAVIKYFYN